MGDNDKENVFLAVNRPKTMSVTLYRFPKPGVRNLRCQLWAKYIFPNRDYTSVAFQEKLHNEHRMLCNRHFKDTDFYDISSKKLFRHALPSDVLHQCFLSGVNISATVCDMYGVNRRALSILGASVKHPYITMNNKDIVTVFDTPQNVILHKQISEALGRYPMLLKSVYEV